MKQEYYFTQMDKPSQAAYRAMYEGFRAAAQAFLVPKLDNKVLSDLFFRLRLDHPEIFYVCSFNYRFDPRAESVKMFPVYMFDKKKIRAHQKALESRIDRLIRPAVNRSPSEKEKYIHDFICTNVTYDKLKKQYSHEIIGPLQQGVGVCEGIAKTVKILCDRLGIQCIIAVSEAALDQGVPYRHAWNVIKIDNHWYHLDATFDNSLGRYGEKRFDYYNLDDQKIFRDHLPLLYPVPACTDTQSFYYLKNRMSLTKIEDVGKRLMAVLRKKQGHFVFHWRGGALNKANLAMIFEEAAKAADQKGQSAKLSVNMAQAVIEITILEKDGSDKDVPVCLEVADEQRSQIAEKGEL